MDEDNLLPFFLPALVSTSRVRLSAVWCLDCTTRTEIGVASDATNQRACRATNHQRPLHPPTVVN